MAPILAFTSDEIWHAMKHDKSANAESVLLNDMPEVREELKLSDESTFRWGLLVSVRDAVNKALENARAAGVFKKAQDTEITLSVAEQKDADFLSSVDLASLCIISKVTVTTDGIEGEKAEDCLIPCTIAVKLSEASQVPPLLEPQRAHRYRRPSRRAVPPLRRCGGRITSVHRPSLRVSVYERLAA